MKNSLKNILHSPRDNITACTIHLLELLQVNVTNKTVETALLSHPYYPSLLSIVDSLSQWGIDTAGMNRTLEQLAELPLPFIVHLTTKGGQFFPVTTVTELHIYYIDDQNAECQFTKDDFSSQWDGVVLLATADELSGESEYKVTKQKEWWDNMLVPVGLIILLLLGILKAGSFVIHPYVGATYFTALMVCKMIGMTVSGLLLWYEYDQHNPLLQKVCSIGKRTNCHAILSSSASKAIGNISWSEVGFIYFTGGFFYLLITGLSSIVFLTILNILALPYIIFSVYYQAHIAKQWCVLCLTVLGLLSLEFLSAAFISHLTLSSWQAEIQQFNHLANQPLSNWLLSAILSFFLPMFVWFFVRPYLYATKRSKELRYQLARFKNNEQVFNALLYRQPVMQKNPEGLGITIGNPEAKNILTKVCNPYCGPCARIHPEIEKLLQRKDNWKVQIIFTATGEENDKRNLPAAHLMAIAANDPDEGRIREALDDWYNAKEKNYDVFAVKYPMNVELKLQKEKLHKMDKWCKEVGITYTPAFFVNGHWLPEQYNVSELKYL